MTRACALTARGPCGGAMCFFFQAEDGIRDLTVTGVQTCALPISIVAIGMAAVMGALTSSAGTTSYLRDKTFAQWVALNKIANLRLSGQQPQTGNSDGDTDFAGRSWHWHQEVVTTEVPGVERIDVSVRPADLKVGADDRSWLTTVSGIWGDAVGTPNGFQPDWGSQFPAGPEIGRASCRERV